MTARTRILIYLACGLLLVSTALQSPIIGRNAPLQGATDEIRRQQVAPGIEHFEMTRARDGGERCLINVLDVDPAAARLEVALAMDEIVGAEKTSSLAERYGAIAAINGGYFRTTGIARGEPAGVLFRHGRLLSEAVQDRAGLAITNSRTGIRVAITHVSTTAKVTAGNVSRKIDGINRPGESGELILYTPEFHRTTLTSHGRIEIAVSNQRVVSVNAAGSQGIPERGYIMSATGAAGDWLREHLRTGRRVSVEMTATGQPPPPFNAEFFLGGGPQLISGGSTVSDSEFSTFSESLIGARHPRTAFGMRRDGRLLLVTVDGRQPSISVGMTIKELIGLMLELQCVEALNLDGGGSTTMVIREKVVNRPSDQTGERPVSDALLLFVRPERQNQH